MTSPLYDKVKAAIVAAVPEIFQQSCKYRIMHDENECPFKEHYRPITLEDVLRALDKRRISFDVWVAGDGTFQLSEDITATVEAVCRWIPGKPLSQQDEPTLQFLADVLCKETT